jgi:hypothetical protein
VTCTEAKLSCVYEVSFRNVSMIVFRSNFSKSLPVLDRRLIGRKFSGNFGFLPGFGRAVIQSLRQ